MNKKISDIMDCVEYYPLTVNEQETQSTERIVDLTMRKINAEKAAGYSLTPRGVRKGFASIAAAFALTLALAGVALAAVLSRSDFFESVFGNGISGRPEVEVVTKPSGSSYERPVIERVEVDVEKADAILGDYIAESGKVMEVNGFTFTIQSYVMDKNGIACLSYTLENPDGLDILHDAGGGVVYYYDEAFFPENMRLVDPLFETTSGKMLDERTYIDNSRSTDTKAALVTYITPFYTASDDDGIVMSIKGSSADGDGNYTLKELDKLIMPAASKVGAQKFTGEEFSVSVSPVGIMITTTLPNIDGKVRKIIINYADGGEYIVSSDSPNVYNASVASQDENGRAIWEAFNRLVDVDNVESVTINGEELTR